MQHSADAVAGSKSAAVSYTYDADGDELTEQHDHGCSAISSCTFGTTTKWYDGADRLVEVKLPHDAVSDVHPYPWLTRYLYDFTQNGTVALSVPLSSSTSAGSTSSFKAYGNLYDTQEYIDLGFGSTRDASPRWVDHLGTAYDALDRKIAAYDVARTTSTLDTYAYDQTASTLDLLSTHTKPTGESIANSYDALGRIASISYQNDGGVTLPKAYTYDPDGRVASIASSSAIGRSHTYTTSTATFCQRPNVLASAAT